MSQATLGSTPYQNSSLFSGYYLDERIADLDGWDCDEAAQAAFEDIQTLWDLERGVVDSHNEDELLDGWIDEVLDVLGFDTLSEEPLPDSGGFTDRLLYDSPENRIEAAEHRRDGDVEATYGLASAVLEAKQWDADFTKRFSEQRSYRDASHQIKYYLEHTPDSLQWGVLTDGRKWRLYGTKDYATEIYYEVDLPELLDSGTLEQFKYFYAFFRPEAFREVGGASFLDTVWNESETAAQELGEDLQDNVFTALRVLGEGFVASNDLDIDPDDESAREDLKEQSLVLLYRLMFVLYAESRGLIHPEDPDRKDEYEQHFSLDALRLEIHEAIASGDSYEDYSGHSTQMWSRLEDLFSLVDEGEASLGIPPYNGGLFDDGEHEFLAEHEVADRYIAEVIHRLGTTEGEEGGAVLADYADLDTRHLGSIYEGLLEHEFRIAGEQYAAVAEDGGQVWKPATEVSVADAVETVESGELYVVNDDGERKATGAYYTPDYVVSYIVEETVDPLLDGIKADLEADGLDPSDQAYFGRFYRQVQDLKILDPAMGSAHFLTSATAYLTEQVMEVAREHEQQGRDEQDIRRTIAKECIYGVDVNGMAVELGKLSMWLETLAADQPLAFLDHHLKPGNSLVGSDIAEVLSDDVDDDGGQLTLMQAAARARKNTLEHVMELMQDLLAIDNETLADIKSMEDLYDEIRDDPLYQRLFEIANVHTAEEVGLDVPAGVYEEMAGAIEDREEWAEIQGEDWFRSAQAMADEEDFFHWELEYPEVFFGEDGEKKADAGFDAVVGNPPYVRIQNMRKSSPDTVSYIDQKYQSPHQNYDLALPFTELGYGLLSTQGQFGYIETKKWIQSEYGRNLRKFLSERKAVRSLVDMGDQQVFEGVDTYTVLLFLNKRENDGFRYTTVSSLQERIEQFWKIPDEGWVNDADIYSYVEKFENIGEEPWKYVLPGEREVLDKLEQFPTVETVVDSTFVGLQTSADPVYVLEVIEESSSDIKAYSKELETEVTLEKDITKPLLRGADFTKWTTTECNQRVIFPYSVDSEAGTYTLQPASLIQDKYPKTWDYLTENKSRLLDRADVDSEEWWAYPYPKNLEKFESEKLMSQVLASSASFAIDREGNYSFVGGGTAGGYGITIDEAVLEYEPLLALLNSTLLDWMLKKESSQFQGGYYSYAKRYLKNLVIPVEEVSEEFPEKFDDSAFQGKTIEQVLGELALEIVDKVEIRAKLNLSLRDHLGSYSEDQTLADVGLTQPPKGSADSILQQTTEERPNLRVGEASVERESPNTVEIRLTARYKPDDEDSGTRPKGGSRNGGTGEARGTAHETDQWGYTETEPLPALRITDLTETEADLVEAFVPVAVDEAGGFADFRETATKTNSLVDRLRKLTLPAVDDVRAGLESYTETVARAEELEANIERTDDRIDDIVYELYGLTDEEIEVVEQTVDG